MSARITHSTPLGLRHELSNSVLRCDGELMVSAGTTEDGAWEVVATCNNIGAGDCGFREVIDDEPTWMITSQGFIVLQAAHLAYATGRRP